MWAHRGPLFLFTSAYVSTEVTLHPNTRGVQPCRDSLHPSGQDAALHLRARHKQPHHTAPHRTAPTRPHRTAPHRTAPQDPAARTHLSSAACGRAEPALPESLSSSAMKMRGREGKKKTNKKDPQKRDANQLTAARWRLCRSGSAVPGAGPQRAPSRGRVYPIPPCPNAVLVRWGGGGPAARIGAPAPPPPEPRSAGVRSAAPCGTKGCGGGERLPTASVPL